MELAFKDLIYHKYNNCINTIQNEKSIKAEIEIESKSINGYDCYRYENRDLIF